MKAINDFVNQFNATLELDESLVVRKHNRYFLLNKKLQQTAPKNFFYAGCYLGAEKGTSFFPSFLLLSMTAKTGANKIVVDKKTAWLFICGRDVFKKGITSPERLNKDEYVLVMNEHNECLGFGKTLCKVNVITAEKTVVVKNILDLGDFLRRERHQTKQTKRSPDVKRNRSEPHKRVRKQSFAASE